MITLRDDFDVEYIDHMGDDLRIAQAAWVSTGREGTPEQINGLLKFLMSHRHGTPFEAGTLQVRVTMPIFLWREWHRHRIGFCLSGDTEIWVDTENGNVTKRKLEDLYNNWANGVKDSMGRVRFLRSVYSQKLRVLNEDTGLFELGTINNIVKSGVKECLLVEADHKKNWSIRCSADHSILTSKGWMKAGDLTGNERIAVSGKQNTNKGKTIPPSLRAGIGVWTSMQRNTMINEKDNCYICGQEFFRENLTLDHVVPVIENILLALDIKNLKPACIWCHRTKSDGEQKFANRRIVAGVKFVKLKKKPYVISSEMTYDISMAPPWHNFVANGIVVHNSYNEESGRYKKLEPVFYVPGEARRANCLKPDGYKPSKPGYRGFLARDDEAYRLDNLGLMACYSNAYDLYERRLSEGYDNGLARVCLPVSIYSSCYVTANPRSIMNFLSLRVDECEARFETHPQWEMDCVARLYEDIFAKYWPITYKHFVSNGRVAP